MYYYFQRPRVRSATAPYGFPDVLAWDGPAPLGVPVLFTGSRNPCMWLWAGYLCRNILTYRVMIAIRAHGGLVWWRRCEHTHFFFDRIASPNGNGELPQWSARGCSLWVYLLKELMVGGICFGQWAWSFGADQLAASNTCSRVYCTNRCKVDLSCPYQQHVLPQSRIVASAAGEILLIAAKWKWNNL